MKQVTSTTIYIPIKPENELPQQNYSDVLHTDIGIVGFENGVFGKWTEDGQWKNPLIVREWLKPTEAYIFTQEQLEKLLKNYTDKIVEEVELDTDSFYNVFVSEESIRKQLPKFLEEIGF